MTNTSLLSCSVRDVNSMPTAVDTISSKQETNVSGLEGYRKSLEMEEFRAMQQNLYPNQEDSVLLQVINRPKISELAGVLG